MVQTPEIRAHGGCQIVLGEQESGYADSTANAKATQRYGPVDDGGVPIPQDQRKDADQHKNASPNEKGENISFLPWLFSAQSERIRSPGKRQWRRRQRIRRGIRRQGGGGRERTR